MTPKTMTAKEARDKFTDLLGAVYYGKEPIIVEKKGRPFAVVINPQEYARYRKAAKERFFETVDMIQADSNDKNPDDVLQDVTSIVETVRQDHYDKRK